MKRISMFLTAMLLGASAFACMNEMNANGFAQVVCATEQSTPGHLVQAKTASVGVPQKTADGYQVAMGFTCENGKNYLGISTFKYSGDFWTDYTNDSVDQSKCSEIKGTNQEAVNYALKPIFP